MFGRQKQRSPHVYSAKVKIGRTGEPLHQSCDKNKYLCNVCAASQGIMSINDIQEAKLLLKLPKSAGGRYKGTAVVESESIYDELAEAVRIIGGDIRTITSNSGPTMRGD